MAEAPLPSNSRSSKLSPKKEPRKKLDKVVTSNIKERKKGIGSKVKDSMTGDDARSVGEYVVMDVIVPATKRAIAEAVSTGIERLLFGEVRSRSTNGSRYTSYSSGPRRYSEPPRSERREPREMSYRARAQHDFSEIIIEDRVEAEAVIDNLGNLIDTYNVASVADLYDLVGLTSQFTDQKWGWDDIRGAEIRRIREGYLLLLPKPIAI